MVGTEKNGNKLHLRYNLKLHEIVIIISNNAIDIEILNTGKMTDLYR